MTPQEIIREFWRLFDIVTVAEDAGLLDIDQAQAMRDRYRERADAVLDAHRKEERRKESRSKVVQSL